MSFDLFEKETAERMMALTPVRTPEVGAFDGFIRGTALSTMRGFAKTGSALHLLGSVVPIAHDAFTGGTEAKERYFRDHDEVWGRAVDFWTPQPLEVGAAAEIAGQLISTLPLIIASPALAVGTTQIGTAEDLVKKGVDPLRAQAVGAIQGGGLGLGISMPIFGQTLSQRVLAGGVGFNVTQGIAMRGASEAILKGTPAAEDYQAFDPKALTVDAILGAAFGGIVHLSPTQRAHGAEMWSRIENWAKGLKQTDIDALSVLRQAQHLNADSMGGRPVNPVDIERHVQRVKTAMEQLVRDEPVSVSDLPEPRVEVDPARVKEQEAHARELGVAAEDVRKSEGLAPPPKEPSAPPAVVAPAGAELPLDYVYAPLDVDQPTGGRVFYHGTKATMERLSDADVYSTSKVENLYGEGLYLTDNPNVARGYAQGKGRGASGKVLSAKLNDLNLVDLEKPLPDAAWEVYAKQLANYLDETELAELRGGSGKKVFERLREALADEQMPVSEVQLIYGDLNYELSTKGIDGLRHEGGGFRGQKYGPHNVVILFEDVAVDRTGQVVGRHLKDKFLDESSPVFPKSEAPAAPRGGAEPPPPRGSRPGEAAGAEGTKPPDPLKLAAEAVVTEYPTAAFRVGQDNDGNPIMKTVRQYLDEATSAADNARQDIPLFEAAARCLLGGT